MSATTVDAPVTPARRHFVLSLLFLASVLNLFDRQIINVLSQQIKTELALSDLQLGLLTGTAFGLFYSVFSVPLAHLADRTSRSHVIAASLFLWSLLTAACGFAVTYTHLFLCRMGVGVGEAGCMPASTAIVAEYFPPERRSAAMSLLFFGVPLGSFLGLAIGGAIGESWGWRAAFMVAGVPGIVLALFIVVTLRDRAPREARSSSAESDGSVWTALSRLLADRAYLYLLCGGSFATFLIYVSGAWLPAFLIRAHALTAGQVGLWTGLAVGVGGAVGTLGGGLVVDGTRGRLSMPETTVSAIASGVAAFALLGAVLASSVGLAIAMIAVFNLAAFVWMGPATAMIQTIVPAQSRALAVGVHISIANVFSLMLGVPAVGLLSDWLAPAAGGASLGIALCVAATGGAVAAVAYLLAGRAAATR